MRVNHSPREPFVRSGEPRKMIKDLELKVFPDRELRVLTVENGIQGFNFV
jgi:hypothetical protein